MQAVILLQRQLFADGIAMRPDGIGATAGRFAFAGIDDIDKVYLAIVIRVIKREVHAQCIDQFAGLHNHIGRSHIVVRRCPIVFAVVLDIIAERNGSIDIEDRMIGTVGLVAKVLCCRRIVRSAGLIDLTILGVAERVDDRVRMRFQELLVGKIDHDDYSPRREIRRHAELFAHFAGFVGGTACLQLGGRRSLSDHFVHALSIQFDLLPVAVDETMCELVTHDLQVDGRTIRLRISDPSRTSGNSVHDGGSCNQQREKEYPFHCTRSPTIEYLTPLLIRNRTPFSSTLRLSFGVCCRSIAVGHS